MVSEMMDASLHGFKAKYVFLDAMFNGVLERTTSNKKRLVETVNIFINLESVLTSLRKEKTEKFLNTLTNKEKKFVSRQIIAGILNIAAHYRKYFYRNKISTNIVYYYNDIAYDGENNSYNNSPLIDDYRWHYNHSMTKTKYGALNDFISGIIPALRVISEYIENVYIVSSKSVESSVIPFTFMMESTLPANMNIIVSKDDYDLQYVNQNCMCITRHSNDPVIVTKRNLIHFYNWKNRLDETKHPKMIHHKLFTFLKACLGDNKRTIPKLKGFGYTTLYKGLVALYDAGYIFDEDTDTFNIENLIHVLTSYDFKILKDNELASDIMRNYKCTDLVSQYKIVTDTQKKKLEKQLSDKTDPQSLIELNDRYFGDTPLQLIELNQFNAKRSQRDDVFGY